MITVINEYKMSNTDLKYLVEQLSELHPGNAIHYLNTHCTDIEKKQILALMPVLNTYKSRGKYDKSRKTSKS